MHNRMNTCTRKAYAKINLGLDVLGRLPNGYHEVRMVMQTVDIWDELVFEKTDSGIVLTTDCGELETDESNLVYRAAKLMRETFGIQGGVKIHLRKQIPIAAGMAGGSSDAAAAMRGLNELYGLGASGEKLAELGVRIGADVPYCIMGGTALAEGIGEKLTALPQAPECVLVVAKPDHDISTKEIYGLLDAQTQVCHPDIDGMISAIREGDLSGVAARLGNVLESVTLAKCPLIGRIKTILGQRGACGSLMSGSGPTVFGIFDKGAKEAAAEAAEELEQLAGIKQVFVTRFI